MLSRKPQWTEQTYLCQRTNGLAEECRIGEKSVRRANEHPVTLTRLNICPQEIGFKNIFVSMTSLTTATLTPILGEDPLDDIDIVFKGWRGAWHRGSARVFYPAALGLIIGYHGTTFFPFSHISVLYLCSPHIWPC